MKTKKKKGTIVAHWVKHGPVLIVDHFESASAGGEFFLVINKVLLHTALPFYFSINHFITKTEEDEKKIKKKIKTNHRIII